MASGIFALLDDIATLMDDVAAMSKVAGKKTAGILGDDLAVNAEKASGFLASRELPVLWTITKGSFLNKAIILPLAFLLSSLAPVVVNLILICGGFYLAYEGVEKIYEYLFHRKGSASHEGRDKKTAPSEKKKIRSAIITDFILSVEIIIIALGTVIDQDLGVQIPVVTLIALVATVGVYGIVALIVRMDDFGFKLIRLNERENSISDHIGRFLVNALPWVIKSLGVIGTLALLLVSGGIFMHNFEFLHHFLEPLPSITGEFIAGLIGGSIALLVVSLFKRILKKGS